MIDLFKTFLASYITVFALGIQTKNVAGNYYIAAFFTSALIGFSHVIVTKAIIQDCKKHTLAYVAGGSLGIISSIYIHNLIF